MGISRSRERLYSFVLQRSFVEPIKNSIRLSFLPVFGRPWLRCGSLDGV